MGGVKIIKRFASVTVCAFFAVCVSAQSKSALSLYNEGQNFQSAANYYRAIESYREALDINPRYSDAWHALAQCSYELDQFELCVQYCDEALKFTARYSDIQNLKAMALISLGRLDDAKTVFNEVLSRYPNDVESRFGLAQLSLFNGSLSSAESMYLDALKRDGTNRKALLSLALVSAELGKDAVAQRYVNQALQYHSGNAQVHFLAAYLALRRNDFVDAERRARSAIQIDSAYDAAYKLLADILYAQKRYAEVVDMCDYRILHNRSLSDAWYLKGLAQTQQGQIEKAIASFNTGLSLNPQDEIMRLALEQIVDQNLPIEDARRSTWAAYHIAKAAEYKRDFKGPFERYEYQRALTIDPLGSDARQKYASLLSRDKLWESYLQQIRFIEENRPEVDLSSFVQTDENSPVIKKSSQQVENEDYIEALDSMMIENLAHTWNVDPFYLDKTRWNISVYYVVDDVQLIHPDAERIVTQAVCDIFRGEATTAVEVDSAAVSGYGEAYRLARAAAKDYFVILSVEEMERSVRIAGTLYSARTGTKTADLSVYRTGNARLASALRRFRQSLLALLPIRGRVLAHASKTILTDLGKNDGIEKGAEFEVVRRGTISTVDSGPGIFYRESDIVGTYVAEVVDEELSSGTFTKRGFYDVLNDDDELVLVKLPSKETQDADGSVLTDTRPAGDADGNAATEAAKEANREAVREDLMVAATETPLIEMIRSIR